jgi:hypothetical protein
MYLIKQEEVMELYQDPDPAPIATNLDLDGVHEIMDRYGATNVEREKLILNGNVVIGGVKIVLDRGEDGA